MRRSTVLNLAPQLVFPAYIEAQQARVLVPSKPFRCSLIFAKAEAYPSEAPLRCSTLGHALGLTWKP